MIFGSVQLTAAGGANAGKLKALLLEFNTTFDASEWSILTLFTHGVEIPTGRESTMSTIKWAISQQYTVIIYGTDFHIDWLQKYEEIGVLLQSPGFVLLCEEGSEDEILEVVFKFLNQYSLDNSSISCCRERTLQQYRSGTKFPPCISIAMKYRIQHYTERQLFPPITPDFTSLFLPSGPYLVVALFDEVPVVRSALQSELQNYNFSWRETSLESLANIAKNAGNYALQNPILCDATVISKEISKYGRVALYFRDRHIQLWKLVELVENTIAGMKSITKRELGVVVIWHYNTEDIPQSQRNKLGVRVTGLYNRDNRAKLAKFTNVRFETSGM